MPRPPFFLLSNLLLLLLTTSPNPRCKNRGKQHQQAFSLGTYLCMGHPRKTLRFIQPERQNGEVVVKPTIDMIKEGSKKWETTASGNESSIWVMWITNRYLRHCSVWTARVSRGSWSWRKILKLQSELVGLLIHRFPSGPRVTGIPLESKLSLVINEREWNWPLITDIEHMEIMDHLPRIETSDGVRWNSTTGDFTISDAYCLFHPPGPTVCWHALLHGPLRIPRNYFILWLAILERLSTLDRTWWTGLDSTCTLCSRGEVESHSHLFFQCDYARTCLRILDAEVRFRLPRISWQHTVLWSARRWRAPGDDGREHLCRVDIEYEWVPQRSTKNTMKQPVSMFVQKPPAPPMAREQDHVKQTETLVREEPNEMLGLLENRVAAHNVARVQSSVKQDWNWFSDPTGPGDFNMVLDLSEVSSSLGDISMAMEEFRACIVDTGLLAVPLRGASSFVFLGKGVSKIYACYVPSKCDKPMRQAVHER
ncbi:UNVERIFIED_CONTAM: hypothetical protein Slati_0885000 [Sesamum latifolium]|uniref:Reverse transcriptase zinc-binding domain-containing protein n=1 Tax=Sesamum latifolium TaxID=2727402 RepID=A0AAW2XMU9_9LAMI